MGFRLLPRRRPFRRAAVRHANPPTFFAEPLEPRAYLSTAEVSVAPSDDGSERDQDPGHFTISVVCGWDVEDGDLTVTFDLGGTADPILDYDGDILELEVTIEKDVLLNYYPPVEIEYVPYNDVEVEKDETVILTLEDGANYNVQGGPATNLIHDDEGGETVYLFCDCVSGKLVWAAAGLVPAGASILGAFTRNPVRYFDGVKQTTSTDFTAGGYGTPWGHTRTWSNIKFGTSEANGDGWVVSQAPQLVQIGNSIVAVDSSTNQRWFDFVYDPVLNTSTWRPRFFLKDRLEEVTGGILVTDTAGNRAKYHAFNVSPDGQRGQLIEYLDAAGNKTEVKRYSDMGNVELVERTAGGVTEAFEYFYDDGDPERLDRIEWRHGTQVVREVLYQYYADGTLKLVDIKDGSGATVESKYYRYYATDGANGYAKALKYVFEGRSLARLRSAFGATGYLSAEDPDVEPYADVALKYNSNNQVSEEVVQGDGCGCSGGVGTYGYVYAAPSANPDGFNSYKYKTTETLPDGNKNYVYSNYAGMPMLKVFEEVTTGKRWAVFYRYDEDGRLDMTASPSAVDLPAELETLEQYADLMHDQGGGDYLYLHDEAGVIELQSYVGTGGTPEGYLHEVSIRRGDTTPPVKQLSLSYATHTADGVTVYPIDEETVYRRDAVPNPDDGLGLAPQTTTYDYELHTGGTRPKRVTVTLPKVREDQNGPGTGAAADAYVTYFDLQGRPTWAKDPEGFITFTEYDNASGGVKTYIEDVNTTLVTGEPGEGTGSAWVTPAGGGLHLKTTAVVDPLGRPTKVADPRENATGGTGTGDVTYVRYGDANHEVRVYPGWHETATAGEYTTTGPIEIYREYRPAAGSGHGVYTEALTLAPLNGLVPDDAGVPTGAEAVLGAQVRSLSREYTNTAGQANAVDEYFFYDATLSDGSGVLLRTPDLGTVNTHRYRTSYAYDHRGRMDRVLSPTGTITRAVYDGPGRLVSAWVGTDDTPTTDWWSPTNTAGTNLVKVAENVYDGGGVGDSNLTRTTAYPGGLFTERVTDYWYDWRGRPVLQKGGVEAVEASTGSRPVLWRKFDNLGQPEEVWLFDGDGLSVGADTNPADGVPDKPGTGSLFNVTYHFFDERGRPYLSRLNWVHQGTVYGNNLFDATWYDRRGNVIKEMSPQSATMKYAWDGAGRMIKAYATDAGGDPAVGAANNWSHADDVTGDKVLEQYESLYDPGGNVLVSTTRQRFHDEATETGELGNPNSTGTVPAVRVSFAAYWYDRIGRLTDAVDEGTDGNAASYTRPAAAPARSDTELRTSYLYDAAGRLQDVTDPRGVVFRSEYDLLGRTTRTIEAYVDGAASLGDDRITEYTYDGSGNLLTAKAVLPVAILQTTQYVYGEATKSVNSPITRAGTTATATSTAHGYKVGESVVVSGASPSQYSGTFTVTAATANTFSYVMASDPGASGTGTITARRNTGVFSNDLLTAVRYPDVSTGSPGTAPTDAVNFTHNALGQVKTVADRNGTVRTRNYDVLGRQTGEAVTTLGSFLVNGVTQNVDGAVRAVGFTYNMAQNTRQAIGYANANYTTGTSVTQTEINVFGNPESQIQQRLVSGSVVSSGTVSWQRARGYSAGNNSDRVTALFYPNGRAIGVTYAAGLDNAAHRPTDLYEGSTGAKLEEYEYLGTSSIIERNRPEPGVKMTLTNLGAGEKYSGLDRFGRVIDHQWYKTSTAAYTDRFQYGYDRGSNRLYKLNALSTANSELYHADGAGIDSAYDKLGRLTVFQRGTLTASGTNGTRLDTSGGADKSWTLDTLGNWNAVTGETQSRQHDKRNQLTSRNGVTLRYDPNGNMVRDEFGDQYFYDAWNRLVEVKTGAGVSKVRYAYDGHGRRIARTENSVTTDFFFDGWRVIEERIGGVVKAQYVWGVDYVDSLVLRDRDTVTGGGLEERLYVQQDANYNVTALTDAAGAVVERYLYDPYGSFTVQDANWANDADGLTDVAWRHFHQGGMYDAAVGLYHFNIGGTGRDYDPELGRWIEGDRAGYVDGMSLYQAYRSNPIVGVDPSGQAWHHQASRIVFDPADSNSTLNQLGMSLEDGIDIHGKDYGWDAPAGLHSELHSNQNSQRKRWQKSQQEWLQGLHDKGETVVTKKALKKHLKEMREAYKLTDKRGRRRPGRGAPATADWPCRITWYRFLREAKRLDKSKIPKSAKVLLVVNVARGGRVVKMGARVIPLATIFMDYDEVRGKGASKFEGVMVACVETKNPLPFSITEMSEGVEEFMTDMPTYFDPRDFTHGNPDMRGKMHEATTFE